MTHEPPDEIRYLLLKYLDDHPAATQRELAAELGVSIGKANYCVRALIAKGLVKARNFRNSNKKVAYAYILTPRGIDEKIDITMAFLRRKRHEYDLLAKEIERLAEEVGRLEKAPARFS
jgi:EPS-associated MarR family transcriptional regulator